MLKPARSLLSSPSAATGAMPYNWNWQRRWTEVAGFLRTNPIILMDVGARGDAPPEFESMAEHVLRVGFEADPNECARLNATGQGKFFPNLVAGKEGPLTLNLYENPWISSTLKLNERFARRWIGPQKIKDTFTSDAITLDQFLADHDDLRPDFLKLDTQGTELDILRGTENSLDAIGLVEVEVEFFEHYDGQALFHEVLGFMMERRYELLYLNRVMSSRTQVYTGPSRGQLIFGDALFAKRDDALQALSPVQKAKHCVLLCQFGHMDIAYQIMEENPEVAKEAPGLRSVFKKRSSTVTRGALMQIDKLLALGLHARRYNQRGMDTDRAWPLN